MGSSPEEERIKELETWLEQWKAVAEMLAAEITDLKEGRKESIQYMDLDGELDFLYREPPKAQRPMTPAREQPRDIAPAQVKKESIEAKVEVHLQAKQTGPGPARAASRGRPPAQRSPVDISSESTGSPPSKAASSPGSMSVASQGLKGSVSGMARTASSTFSDSETALPRPKKQKSILPSSPALLPSRPLGKEANAMANKLTANSPSHGRAGEAPVTFLPTKLSGALAARTLASQAQRASTSTGPSRPSGSAPNIGASDPSSISAPGVKASGGIPAKPIDSPNLPPQPCPPQPTAMQPIPEDAPHPTPDNATSGLSSTGRPHPQMQRQGNPATQPVRLSSQGSTVLKVAPLQASVDPTTKTSAQAHGSPAMKEGGAAQPPTSTQQAAYTMDEKQMKLSLSRLLSRLKKEDKQNWFAHPVTDREALNYSSIIRRPMSFDVLQRKVNTGEIRTFIQLRRDIDLMLLNAQLFNPPGHGVWNEARNLRRVAQRLYEQFLEKELSALADAHSGPPPATTLPQAASHAVPHIVMPNPRALRSRKG